MPTFYKWFFWIFILIFVFALGFGGSMATNSILGAGSKSVQSVVAPIFSTKQEIPSKPGVIQVSIKEKNGVNNYYLSDYRFGNSLIEAKINNENDHWKVYYHGATHSWVATLKKPQVGGPYAVTWIQVIAQRAVIENNQNTLTLNRTVHHRKI